MRRIPFVFLALGLAMLIGLASAQTLEFWKFGSAEDPDNQALLGWVDEWNQQNPDTQVEMTFFPFSDYAAGGTVLPTAFASGAGPDIFWTSPGTFMQYAKSGLLADLSSIFTDELRADLLPAALEAASLGGIPYAMPFEQEPLALYYNKDLLANADVEVPKTWDELLAASEKLKQAGITPIIIEPGAIGYQAFVWYPFLWSAGAAVANADLTEATFDSPGAASALDLWSTLIQKGYAPRTVSGGTTGSIAATQFGTEDAAMIVIGIWAIKELQQDFPDINYGVAQIPAPAGMESVSEYGGWSQVVSSRSEHIEAAKEFTAWMWAKDVERPLEWATVINTKFSPRRSVTEAGSEFYDQPHLSEFRDLILPTARAQPRFPPEITKIVSDALQSAMFRNTPGAEAAATAQKELERFLETY